MNRRRAAGATLLALVAGISLLAYHSRPRSAWDRATPLTSNPVWARGVYDYTWLSPHELICLKFESGFKTPRALLVDIRTGKQSVVAPALDLSARISPDGRWLLWERARRSSLGGIDWQKRSYHLTPVRPGALRSRFVLWQGPANFRQTQKRARDFAWLPDSRGWVEVCWPASDIRKRDDSARLVEYRLSGARARVWQVPAPLGACIEWVLGVTPAGEIVAATIAYEGELGNGSGSDLLLMQRSAAKTATVRVCHVGAPPGDGWRINDAELSPDRTRIAWLYERERESTATALLARLRRKYDGATQEYRLRVTDTRGRLVRDLGGQRRVLYNNDLSGWGDVRWLPDGKSLSVRSWNADASEGTFWTLPAL